VATTQPADSPGEPAPGHRQSGLAADLRDAVSPRTAILFLGVLLIELAFILSYVGAFHTPRPHRIPVAVVAPLRLSVSIGAIDNGDQAKEATSPFTGIIN
jgi:hypothetical protein